MKKNGRILVVDDESALRLLLSKELGREGYAVDVVADGRAALNRLHEETYDVVLLDVVMPKLDGVAVLRQMKKNAIKAEVIMLTGNATIESAIECMKLGAYEYVRKPYVLPELVIQIERALERQRSRVDIEFLKEELKKSGYRGNMIGKSASMVELKKMIQKIAPTQSTVLVLGDSGTGKELAARSIHDMSLRKDKQFVAINCASLSETLLESELFGYEKGAFTDAKTQKRGLAEIADGGTLFLDEIGEIPIRFQAKLLRFLETSEIRRVGGTKDISLDVRIICATNKPLEELMKHGEFREDLFYRLNVLSFTVPPLRDHPEDIPSLAENFVAALGFQKRFDGDAIELMKLYDWPGNVRELKNIIERTCIMSPNSVITAEDLGFLRVREKPRISHKAAAAVPVSDWSPISLREMERRHIVSVLKYVSGHKGKAARLLEINAKTLYNKMRMYNIVSSFE